MLPYNRKLKDRSRQLRTEMTDAEKLFWAKVRRKQLNGYQFYRQKTLGNYIVDFYCPKANLVVEIDGSQHYEKTAIEYDSIRDDYLRAQGLKVLRFSNLEVLQNTTAVMERVYACKTDPAVLSTE